MKIPNLARLAGDLVGDVLDPGRRHRRSWAGNGRAHIDVRGVHLPTSGALLGDVEAALRRLDGVDWAEANAVTGRIVVAFDDDAMDMDDLVDAVEGVEEAYGVHRERFADRPEHPADREPLQRNQVALGADLLGLGLSGIGLLIRFAPLPVEVASLVSAIDTTPRLRRIVDERLGPAGDLTLAVVNAAAQGLSSGPLGLLVDIGHRAGLITEIAARNRTWDTREPELVVGGPVPAGGEERRPVPLPRGPVERYADVSAVGSLATFGLSMAALRDPRRAAEILIAALPKAARLGREAFAAQLGRILAERGGVIMDPSALRRLDRVDTAVFDATILTTGELVLGAVAALTDRPKGELRRRAQLLFSPGDPDGVVRDGDWALGPIGKLARTTPAIRAIIGDLPPGSRTVLGLAHQGQLVGAVAVVDELDELAGALVGAARHAGLSVVIAGGPSSVGAQLGADRRVPGWNRLAGSVRALQAEGRVVALVGSGPAALQAADWGVGVLRPGRRPPWGCDVIVGPGLATAVLAVAACRAARQVSRTSAQLSLAGSVAGGVMTLTGPPQTAGRRALLPVNGAALVSVANGAWSGIGVGRRTTPVAGSSVAWHALEADEVLRRLGTDRHGLTNREAARRPHEAMAGDDASTSTPSILHVLGEELANPLTPVLVAGAAMSAAVGSVVDAALVGGVSGLNALLGAAQRVGTERSLQRLLERSSGRVTVTRDGEPVELSVGDVVVGDIVHLGAGEVVPADGRILECDALEVDESALTGESQPVAKTVEPCPTTAVSERQCMIFDDTTVAAGTVTAVVVAVGRATEAGRALAGAAAPPASGVENRLRGLTRITVPVTVASGGLATLLGVVRGRPLAHALQAGVSLTVAAVPEGLPVLATVAQTASARRLSTHNALVRHPRAIEALGRVDLLCFDKTGTLTEGHLSLRKVSDGTSDQDVADLDLRHRHALAAGLRATPAPQAGEALPHATDQAVAVGAAEARVTRELGAGEWVEIDELPFASERGFHAVIGQTSDGHRVAVKGAPEFVLPRCQASTGVGGTVTLDPARRRQLDDEVDRLARQGFRVLAVAEGRTPPSTDVDDADVADLELVGFLAFGDPVRPSAAEAIGGLRRAGVGVAMITGDHASTAESIAAELGILNGGRILTGPDLDELDDEQLALVLPATTVFARVTPAHKVRIVEGYQRAGRVVAMTGDGANDAPAIRLANVGIALGRRGGISAREAADLVVTDDQIETIVLAIIEGRAMWASVRDALAILIGGNLGEVAFTLAATALAGNAPLNTRQLLLVNLLTDLLPAMAIALRPPSHARPEQLLDEGPDASLGSALRNQIALRAATTALGATGGWLVARASGPPARARTVGLATLVGTQLGQTILAGGRSPVVVLSTVGSAASLFAIVQTPGVSHFFGCTPLDPLAWATVFGASSLATAGSVVVPAVAGWVRSAAAPSELASSEPRQPDTAAVRQAAIIPLPSANPAASTAPPKTAGYTPDHPG